MGENNTTPPENGTILEMPQDKPSGNAPKKVSSGVWSFVALIALLAFVSFETYYQVEPDEVGVILRLGRYLKTSQPGPHVMIPLIDEVFKVPVQRQMKLEFGFRSLDVDEDGHTTYYNNDKAMKKESLMLTGDLNVAMVEWIVQYKIKDPYEYLFKVRNVKDTLRVLAETSMRLVVGDHSVNEVLTTGRQQVADQAKLQLQTLADKYECGVDIQQLVLQDVNPPDRVKPSFNEVNQAIQEKERAINEAQAEMNKEIPLARGQAEQLVKSSEGYSVARINNAKGDVEKFNAMYNAYKQAPEITRRRMYLETMAKILPQAGTKVVVDENSKGMTPFIQMAPEAKKISKEVKQ